MIEKKNTYCFVIYNVKDDLPCGCFDTYGELAKHFDMSKTTIWRAIKDRVPVKGKYYIEKVLL